ncbi:hypothetical protein EK904_010505 [Melospiza melodia maxima]|nr:hypothetical protein EK904_010505 [Melospiza melodia maxima]
MLFSSSAWFVPKKVVGLTAPLRKGCLSMNNSFPPTPLPSPCPMYVLFSQRYTQQFVLVGFQPGEGIAVVSGNEGQCPPSLFFFSAFPWAGPELCTGTCAALGVLQISMQFCNFQVSLLEASLAIPTSFFSRPSQLSHSTTPTLDPGLTRAGSTDCTRVLRVTPGEPCHGQALLWQHQFVLVPVLLQQLLWASISSFPCQLFSHGGLVVASSTVGTALPIPAPSHGAAGHSGRHLLRAACVWQPELVPMSTLRQCFACPLLKSPSCGLWSSLHTPSLGAGWSHCSPAAFAQCSGTGEAPTGIHGEHGVSGRVLAAAQGGVRLSRCLCQSSSSPAPQALLAGGKSGRCRFGEQRGAGCCGWGRAGWSCNHSQDWSGWIPLNRALCLGGLGARGAATAPGQGKNRQRLIAGTSTVCDPDSDTLCPQSQAVAAP